LFLGWVALMTLAIGTGLVLSAQAAWRGHHAGRSAPDPRASPAAAFDLLTESAAPASGVTGTTALPALPVPAAYDARGGGGIVAARPFSMAGASATDRGRALDCLATAIYFEAATEPDAGQQAVAQVILNRVRHPAFPATVCGVVYQGSDRSGCQFSFACDGAMTRKPLAAAWARAVRVAAAALNGRVFAGVGLATHYHTFAVTPGWNRALVMTDAVGAHFFHRWKGYWGTPAAFTQVYLGHEPVPGPHGTPPLPPTALAIAANGAPPAIATGPTIATPIIPSAAPSPAPPKDNLPPASEILDRWKDSGKPLR
jgi:spore germination cell wall hydrolase CwlJ-like protein